MISMNTTKRTKLNKDYLTTEEIKYIENIEAGLKIWNELENIVTDDDGNIEEDFHGYVKGTELNEIHLWLEYEYGPFSVGRAYEGYYEEVKA